MLNKLIQYTQKKWQQIKPNDIVIVHDDGKQVAGRIIEYTPDKVVISVIQDIEFDAKKVTIEKIN